MSDMARKRTIADWVVKTKKQIVKLYVVVKWSRDADVVQKAMVCSPLKLCTLSTKICWCQNITAFLLQQSHQFEEAIGRINYAKDGLAPAK